MTFEEIQEWWLSYVGSQEALFVLRMWTGALGLSAASLAWWEAARPLDYPLRRSRWTCQVWAFLRVLLALALTFTAVDLILAGLLERDRAGLPVRLIVKDASLGLLYWALILHAALRRKESWTRRARRGEAI